MRQRLYFMAPNVDMARGVVDALLLERLEVRHIHCLASRETRLEGLPEASFLQKSDAVHGAEMGVVIGGIAGILGGLVVILFPPAGLSFQLGTILVTALVGALFGAWAASLAGTAVPNTRLRSFSADLDGGKVLIMADVPMGRALPIRRLIEERFPEARCGGKEPTIPAFP